MRIGLIRVGLGLALFTGAMRVQAAELATLPPAITPVSSHFLYSQDFVINERQLIELDVQRLNESRLDVGDSFWRQELRGLVTPPRLTQWLKNRIQYFISINHPISSAEMRFGSGRFTTSLLLGTESVLKPAQQQNTTLSSNDWMLMRHLSGPIYLDSRRDGRLRQFHVLGQSWVNVTSPRVGIVQAGPAFFRKINTVSDTATSWVDTLYRLQTLFHEARHSDGHGAHAVFEHEFCPQGHSYEGRRACDSMSNGPYRVGAELMKLMQSDCVGCSIVDEQILELLRADSLDRVLPIKQVEESSGLCEWAFTPEARAELCDPIKRLQAYEKDPSPEVLVPVPGGRR